MADAERIKRALDSLVYLPSLKKRAIDPLDADPTASVCGASTDARATAVLCRPWDRSDLFRRVHTYKASTWFCKPDTVGPIQAARRGWINSGIDLLTCEFCKAKLSFPVPPNFPRDDLQKAAEAFREKLDSGHDSTCPWRGSACQPSLAQFPPLPPEAVAEQFEARAGALQRLDRLPPLAAGATLRHLNGSSREQLDALLRNGPATIAPPTELRVPSLDELDASSPEARGPGALGTAENALQASENGGNVGVSRGRAPNGHGSVVAEHPAGLEGLLMEPAAAAAAGTDAFVTRQRLLALTGWKVRVAGGGPLSAEPGGEAARVLASKAILYCTICGATAGLWAYISEESQPYSNQSAAAESSRPAAAAAPPPARPRPSSAGTTIAGGTLVTASSQPFGTAGAAVFGSPAPAVFGTPRALPPANATAATPATAHSAPRLQPARPYRTPSLKESLLSQTIAGGLVLPQQAAGPFGASVGGAAGQAATPVFGQRAGSKIPAFGIEAVKSPIQRSPSSAAAATAAATAASSGPSPAAQAAAAARSPATTAAFPGAAQGKRLREEDGGATPPAKRAALGPDSSTPSATATGAEPSGSTPLATAAGSAATPAGAPAPSSSGPSDSAVADTGAGARNAPGESAGGGSAALAAAEEAGLHPIGLHRLFCPWVNGGASGSSGSRCGWRWCLAALAPGGGASAADTEDAQQQAEAGWDPAASIRSILRRVDGGGGPV